MNATQENGQIAPSYIILKRNYGGFLRHLESDRRHGNNIHIYLIIRPRHQKATTIKFDHRPSLNAMANFTGDENYISVMEQALSATPAGILELLSALNIFLSITASFGNVLILIALGKVSSIHPTTKHFCRSLAISDLCVGVIVQPLFATYMINLFPTIEMDFSVFSYVLKGMGASSLILCGLSVATSTAISVDRLLALLLGLKYRHIVTLRRVRVVVICFWLFSSLHGWVRIWKREIAFRQASIALVICLVISICCYSWIHHKLRQQQAQVQKRFPRQGQANGESISLCMARYKKTVSTIMWVQLALGACYFPWGIVAVLHENAIEHGLASVWIAVTLLVFLNSSLNPILYCWKIREVRVIVKDTIRQLACL